MSVKSIYNAGSTFCPDFTILDLSEPKECGNDELFKNYAWLIFNSEHSVSEFSLIATVKLCMCGVIWEISAPDKYGNETTDRNEKVIFKKKYELILAFEQFMDKGNKDPIVNQLKMIDRLFLENKEEISLWIEAQDPLLKAFVGNFAQLIDLFEKGDDVLFRKSISDFNETGGIDTKASKYCVSIKSCSAHFSKMICLGQSIKIKFRGEMEGLNAYEMQKSLYKDGTDSICDFFINEKCFPDIDNHKIIKRFQMFVNDFNDKYFDFKTYFYTVFIPGYIGSYSEVISFNITHMEIDECAYDLHYVNENMDVYKSFLPKSKEVVEFLSLSVRDLKKLACLLKDFQIYFKFGNMERLRNFFSSNDSHKIDALKSILVSEIEAFACKDQYSQLKNILAFLGKNAVAAKFKHHFSCLESHFKEIEVLINDAAGDSLGFALTHEKNLFIFPPLENRTQTSLKKNGRSNAPHRKDLKSIGATEISTPKSEISIKTQRSSPKKENDALEPSILEQMQHLRVFLHKSMKNLIGETKKTDVQNALSNAQNHLDDLFISMRRMTCHFSQESVFGSGKKTPLHRRDVHAFVVNCVRHATLSIEQMLLAFRCEQKNDAQVTFSHDFSQLLSGCIFDPNYPQPERDFLDDTNLGEILVRDFGSCTAHETSQLRRLLLDTRRYMQGDDICTKEVLNLALLFCEKTGKTVHSLQMQIIASLFPAFEETINNNGSVHYGREIPEKFSDMPPFKYQKFCADAFNSKFASLCSNLLKMVSGNIKVDETPLSIADLDLISIRNLILDHKESGLDCNNVLDHLLVHLETEMTYHPCLDPIDAHIHCSNVLMLNQIILEEVLLKLLQLPYVENHDLFVLVKEYGMSETDFSEDELDFLRQGKGVRQLSRYASHSCHLIKNGCSNTKWAKNLKETIINSLELSLLQKMTDVYIIEPDYKISDTKMSKPLNAVKALVVKDISYLKSILEKVHLK